MSVDRREGQLTSITLKQALIETTFNPGRVYEGPDVFDLATLQPDTEELIDFTLTHPQRHEAGRFVYVTRDGRVITNKKIIAGGRNHVVLKGEIIILNIPFLDRRLRQDKFVGSEMHSHSVDSIFSPTDLNRLLYGDEIPDCAASVMLVTPKRKILILRGPQTPSYSVDEIREKMEYLNRFVLNNSQLASRTFFGWRYKDTLGHETRMVIRDIASENDLQVFEGSVRDRFLRRVSNNEIAA